LITSFDSGSFRKRAAMRQPALTIVMHSTIAALVACSDGGEEGGGTMIPSGTLGSGEMTVGGMPVVNGGGGSAGVGDMPVGEIPVMNGGGGSGGGGGVADMPVMNGGGGSGGEVTDMPAAGPSFAADIYPIFTAKCAGMGCHSVEPFPGDVELGMAQPDIDVARRMARAHITRIINRLEEGTMPPDGAVGGPITPDELALIQQWQSTGFAE
jgi:hypothetical protein